MLIKMSINPENTSDNLKIRSHEKNMDWHLHKHIFLTIFGLSYLFED